MSTNKGGGDSGILTDNLFTVSLKNDEEMEKYLNKKEVDEENNFISSDSSSDGNEKGELEEYGKKPLKERLFGKIDAGSVRGSIFNLAILSLGSGCLALPQKFGQMSILVTVIDIILAGFAAYWTLNLMIMASAKHKIYNYSKLVEATYGKCLSLFLDITMLIYIFGIMILYQVIGKIIF